MPRAFIHSFRRSTKWFVIVFRYDKHVMCVVNTLAYSNRDKRNSAPTKKKAHQVSVATLGIQWSDAAYERANKAERPYRNSRWIYHFCFSLPLSILLQTHKNSPPAESINDVRPEFGMMYERNVSESGKKMPEEEYPGKTSNWMFIICAWSFLFWRVHFTWHFSQRSSMNVCRFLHDRRHITIHIYSHEVAWSAGSIECRASTDPRAPCGECCLLGSKI